LDRCTDRPEDAAGETAEERALFVGTGKADVDNWELDSDEDEPPAKSKSKGMWDTLKLLAGGSRELKKEDLAPVLEQFKELLIAKNVASECAEKLCTSVGSSLEGKIVSGYNGVKLAVKAAMEEGLIRILTPKQDMDIIRQVLLTCC
jgi:signal recognition particle receptor subunit alpha